CISIKYLLVTDYTDYKCLLLSIIYSFRYSRPSTSNFFLIFITSIKIIQQMKKITRLLFVLLASIGFAQEDITYQKPPQEILDLVDFQRAPSISMDSKREQIVFMYRNTYKTLAEISEE